MKRIILLTALLILISSLALYAQDLKFTFWAKSNVDYVRVITNADGSHVIFVQVVFVNAVDSYKCLYFADIDPGYEMTRSEAYDLAERIKRGRIKGAGHFRFGSGKSMTFNNPSGIGVTTGYKIDQFIFN